MIPLPDVPEVEALRGVEQNEHHQEGDALEHTKMVVSNAMILSGDVRVVVAALLHDIGKAQTQTPHPTKPGQ